MPIADTDKRGTSTMKNINIENLEDLLSKADTGPRRKDRLTFAKEIADLSVSVRHKHGMSQRDLADAINVRQATISRWELKQNIPGPWELRTLLELAKRDPMPNPSKAPRPQRAVVKQIDLRDQFAMAALPAIIQNKGIQTTKLAAEIAYAMADAMLEEREAK